MINRGGRGWFPELTTSMDRTCVSLFRGGSRGFSMGSSYRRRKLRANALPKNDTGIHTPLPWPSTPSQIAAANELIPKMKANQ